MGNIRAAIPMKFHATSIKVKYDERDTLDATRSKTASCSIHKLTYGNCKFEIMDTPGINDTSGFEQDDANVNMIFNAIAELGELHCIIFLLNGTHSRLTISVENVIQRFMRRIPEDFIEHLILILTNCNEYRVNFNVGSSSLARIQKSNIFYMQNSIFSCDRTQLSSEHYSELEKDWYEAMKTLELLVKENMMKMSSLATNVFQVLDEKRNLIADHLRDMHQNVQKLMKLQDECTLVESELCRLSQDKEGKIQLIKKMQDQQTETVSTPIPNTICRQCYSICSNNSLQEPSSTTKYETDIRCESFELSTDTCDQCKCPINEHYQDTKIIRLTNIGSQCRLQELQSLLKDVNSDVEKYYLQQKAVQNNIQSLEDAIGDISNEVETICRQLKQISIKYNPANDLSEPISKIKTDSDALELKSCKIFIETIMKRFKNLCEELNDPIDCNIHNPPAPLEHSRKKKQNCKNKHRYDPFYLKDWSTSDLYDRYATNRECCYEYDDIPAKEVASELKRRVRGEDFGRLSKQQLLQFGSLFQSYQNKSERELEQAAHKIDNEIRQKTENYKHLHRKIPYKTILELAVIKLLLNQVK